LKRSRRRFLSDDLQLRRKKAVVGSITAREIFFINAALEDRVTIRPWRSTEAMANIGAGEPLARPRAAVMRLGGRSKTRHRREGRLPGGIDPHARHGGNRNPGKSQQSRAHPSHRHEEAGADPFGSA
jgi:hypothetical protein